MVNLPLIIFKHLFEYIIKSQLFYNTLNRFHDHQYSSQGIESEMHLQLSCRVRLLARFFASYLNLILDTFLNTRFP